MNDVIRVNDLVTGCNFTRDVEYNDLQGIVLQDFGVRQTFYEETPQDTFETWLFEVEWANGDINDTPHYNLKKIKPDGEDLMEMLERVKSMDLEVV